MKRRPQVGVDRARVLGGRTMHWNAVTLRYAPQDFREWTLAGVEDDWPLTYEELAPYYERVEQIIGVCGNDDGLEILPAGKHYLPPLPWRCSEHILKRATDALNIPLISVRKAVLTKPYDNRPPCHYCGHCMDGCDVSAIFTSPGCTLPKAAATGNFTLRQNALAREILVDREGRARAVSFVDTATGKTEEVKARIVVVCAATVESARLLLNSVSPQHPAGLGNSSGVVGHYLHGHVDASAQALPEGTRRHEAHQPGWRHRSRLHSPLRLSRRASRLRGRVWNSGELRFLHVSPPGDVAEGLRRRVQTPGADHATGISFPGGFWQIDGRASRITFPSTRTRWMRMAFRFR